MDELLKEVEIQLNLSPGVMLPRGGVSFFLERPFVALKVHTESQALDLEFWTSVEGAWDRIRIQRAGAKFHLHLCGGRDHSEGIALLKANPQEMRRNQRLADRLAEAGFQVRLDIQGEDSVLHVSRETDSAADAVEASHALGTSLLERLGVELALANLLAMRPNVVEITDHTLGAFLPGGEHKKAVIFSEMTQCIRCRNNWDEVVRLSESRPDLQFGIVFLNKSRAAFKKWMFAHERPEIISRGIVAPTAFLISDGSVKQYVGTQLEEPLPRPEDLERAIEATFGS